MTPKIKSLGISLFATLFAASVAVAQSSQAGQTPPPTVSVQNMAGDHISLQQMEAQGSPIFLFFINTQDNTSTAAAGYINKIAGAYVPSKTKWFGISNGPGDRLRAYNAEMNPPYQIMIDTGLSSMQTFRAQTSPTIVEIGSDGTVMHTWTGYSASMLKHLNRAVATANGVKPAAIDFSRAPVTTQFGHPFIGAPGGGSPGG